MTAGSLYRKIAKSLAPLREGTAEGAIASEGWQDKRDSLWRSLAVVLVLLLNVFTQAAHSKRSLSVSTSRCLDSPFFTSLDSFHVW
jgi:hypothetical protein